MRLSFGSNRAPARSASRDARLPAVRACMQGARGPARRGEELAESSCRSHAWAGFIPGMPSRRCRMCAGLSPRRAELNCGPGKGPHPRQKLPAPSNRAGSVLPIPSCERSWSRASPSPGRCEGERQWPSSPPVIQNAFEPGSPQVAVARQRRALPGTPYARWGYWVADTAHASAVREARTSAFFLRVAVWRHGPYVLI